MNKSILLLLGALVIMVYAGCKKEENNCIEGNGQLKQETRNIGSFNYVYARGEYKLSVSQTNDYQVDLFGDSNILSIIGTTMAENELLNIRPIDDQCYNTINPVEVHLTAPTFRGVTMKGSGSIEAHGLVVDELYFEIEGAIDISSSFETEYHATRIFGDANITSFGSAENAEFHIGGTGDIMAANLNTNICEIIIEGTGDVRVHVNDELTVKITGSGNVYYTGDPDVISEITGTGKIIKQ